jgi:hypothetical protein
MRSPVADGGLFLFDLSGSELLGRLLETLDDRRSRLRYGSLELRSSQIALKAGVVYRFLDVILRELDGMALREG